MALREYIKWSAINNIAVSCSSVISTNSMLQTIATPTIQNNLAINYIGKDILGQLGALFYVWKTAKKTRTSPLNYVTTGAVLQQTSFFLENSCLNSQFPLPILGISNILKNISFISIGAVNFQKLTTLQSQDSSVGELYSKVAAINTLSSTAGLVLGLGVLYMVPSHEARTFICLPLLGLLSIYSLRKITKINILENK